MNIIQKLINSTKDIFRPVLSDRSILKYNKKGLLVEGEILPSQVQPNSIDLTLGNTWKKLKSNSYWEDTPVISTHIKIEYDEGTFCIYDNYKGKDVYVLMPGEFVLMASREILNIPNGILSFVQGRSSIARLGIQTEQAGLIDAGFRGTITFEVKNDGEYPIVLFSGMRVAQVYFFKAQYALRPYGSENKGSKYQMQIDATGSKIHLDPELK